MNQKIPRGKLITLEGIDGSGKTSQLTTIGDWLSKNKIRYLSAFEPGNTALGEQIRTLLASKDYHDMDCYAELFLFFADRAQHLSKVVEPALQRGLWVVSDRFYDSSYAYQGGGRGIPSACIDALVRWGCCGLKPNLSFLFDIAPELVRRRNSQFQISLFDNGKEKDHRFESSRINQLELEKEQFFTRVRKAYLQRAKQEPERWRLIHAGQSPQLVAKEIAAVLDRMKQNELR